MSPPSQLSTSKQGQSLLPLSKKVQKGMTCVDLGISFIDIFEYPTLSKVAA